MRSPRKYHSADIQVMARYNVPVTGTIPKNSTVRTQIIDLSGHSLGHLGIITPDQVLFVGDSLISIEALLTNPFLYLANPQQQLVTFDNLKPGLYYLIIMMQEYEFAPNSHTVKITDGLHVKLDIDAKRIAYSCLG